GTNQTATKCPLPSGAQSSSYLKCENKAIAHCLQQNVNGLCIQCENLYYQNSNGTCAPISSTNCKNSDGLTNKCQTCNSGYDNNNGVCTKPFECVNGTLNGNTCICNEGWGGTNCDEDITADLIGNREGINNSEINLNNTYNRNVYGVYKNATAYNAQDGDGRINISNTGNGDVYGVYGTGTYTYNVENTTQDGAASGEIQIQNLGNGNVYGVYGTDNVSSRTSVDTYGLIHLYNSGTGNMYGIYKDQGNIYNVWRKGTGVINLFNHSTGNAYGMYGKYVHNENDTDKSSLVEITNAGNGLAVGIYAKDGTIENSGDVKIHNLANGTAVGIYADGTTRATNTGNITIDRTYSAIDDTLPDALPDAVLDGHGKAVGIYGAADSTIINKGTIRINGAEKAYGIYTEGNNVTNTGTILIDGQYTENAIRLNGGQLFQNGVLKIGANWDNNGQETLNCVHGTQSGNACVCDTGYTGTLCDTCANDYYMSNGQCYTEQAYCNARGYTQTFCNTNQTATRCPLPNGTQSSNYMQCQNSTITHCVNQDNSGSCTLCESLYYPNSNGTCSSISSTHCKSSNGLTNQCLECYTGYYPGMNNICTVQYIANCNAYEPNENKCTICQNLYYPDSDGTCSPVSVPNCKLSNGITNECNDCIQGYLKDGNRCVEDSECVHGTISGSRCFCDAGYTGNLCNTCASGYFMSNDQCYTEQAYCRENGYTQTSCGTNQTATKCPLPSGAQSSSYLKCENKAIAHCLQQNVNGLCIQCENLY
ncbi:MAG: hypothetical protein VZR95_09145, partial [Alphaproteobacteria bacterium]